MRILKLTILFLLRVIGGLIAIFQIIGLFTTYVSRNETDFAETETLLFLAVKLVFLVIGIGLYKGLQGPYDRLRNIKNDNDKNDKKTIPEDIP